MSYVCAICHVNHPCTNEEHNRIWSNKQWMPSGALASIACFVLDHEECTQPLFCKCRCHNQRLDEESPISVPPTNR